MSKKIFKWQKKIGDVHIAGTNSTLCGRPMLGNNYAVQDTSIVDCEICLEKQEEQEKVK